MSNSDIDKERIWEKIKAHQDFPVQDAPSKRKWGILLLFGGLFMSMTFYFLSRNNALGDTAYLGTTSSDAITLDSASSMVASTETPEINYSNQSECNANSASTEVKKSTTISEEEEDCNIQNTTPTPIPSFPDTPLAIDDSIDNKNGRNENNTANIYSDALTPKNQTSVDLLEKTNLLGTAFVKTVIEDNLVSLPLSLHTVNPRNALITTELEKKNFRVNYKVDQAAMPLLHLDNLADQQPQGATNTILFSAGIGTYKLSYVDSLPIPNEKFFSGKATKSYHASLGYQYQKASLFGRVSAGFSFFENELDYISSEIKYLENMDTERIEKWRYDDHYNFHHYLFQYSISTVLGNRFQFSTMSLSPYIGGSYQIAYGIRGNVLDTSSEVVNAHSTNDFKSKNRFALNFGIDIGKSISANNALFLAFDCSRPHRYTNDNNGKYNLLSYRLSFGFKHRLSL